MTLQLDEIATLGTPIATHGTLRGGEHGDDEVFEMMIALVELIRNG